MHSPTANKTAAETSDSAVFTPVCVTATAEADILPLADLGFFCSKGEQQGGLRIAQHQNGLTQQPAYHPQRQPPYRIVGCARTNPGAQSPQPHSSTFVHRCAGVDPDLPQHIRSDARQISLLTTAPLALQATSGKTSVMCGEMEVQRHKADAVQRGRPSHAPQLESQSSYILQEERGLPFNGAKRRPPVLCASTEQVTLSRPPLQSLTQERVAVDHHQRLRLIQHRQAIRKGYYTSPQKMWPQQQPEPQASYILQRPQHQGALLQQQPLPELQELVVKLQQTSFQSKGGTCTSMPMHSTRWQSPPVKGVAQLPHTVSSQDDVASRASREPQQLEVSAAEQQKDHPVEGNWIVGSCKKETRAHFYEAKLERVSMPTAGSAEEAETTSCGANRDAENQLTPSGCYAYTNKTFTDIRHTKSATGQTETPVEYILPSHAHTVEKKQDAVGCAADQRIASQTNCFVALNAHGNRFSCGERLPGFRCRQSALHQHSPGFSRQQLYGTEKNNIGAGEKDARALLTSSRVNGEGQAHVCKVSAIDSKSETFGDDARCNSGVTRTSTREKVPDVQERRDCPNHAAAPQADTGIPGDMAQLTTPETRPPSPADDRLNDSGTSTTTKFGAAVVGQHPRCSDKTAGGSAGAGAMLSSEILNTAMRQSHSSSEENSTDLLLRTALKEAILVPPSINAPPCSTASEEPRSLLAVHVAVAKLRDPKPPRPYNGIRCADKNSVTWRPEPKPHAVACSLLSCGEHCSFSSDGEWISTNDEDSSTLKAADSRSKTFRSSSNQELFSYQRWAAGGHSIGKNHWGGATPYTQSSDDVATERAGSTAPSRHYNSIAFRTTSRSTGCSEAAKPAERSPREHVKADIARETRENRASEVERRERWQRQEPCSRQMQPTMNQPSSNSLQTFEQNEKWYDWPSLKVYLRAGAKLQTGFDTALTASVHHVEGSAIGGRLPSESATRFGHLHRCSDVRTPRRKAQCRIVDDAIIDKLFCRRHGCTSTGSCGTSCSLGVDPSEAEKISASPPSSRVAVPGSTPETPPLTATLMTQMPVVDDGFVHCAAHSDAETLRASLTENPPVDGKETVDGGPRPGQNKERFSYLQDTPYGVAPSSAAPDNASISKQTGSVRDLNVPQAKQQHEMKDKHSHAIPLPELEEKQVPCPVSIGRPRSASESRADSTPGPQPAATSAVFAGDPQTPATSIAVTKEATGRPQWQKGVDSCEDVSVQVVPVSQLSSSSACKPAGSSRGTPALPEKEAHQLNTGSMSSEPQQLLPDHITLRYGLRQRLGVGKIGSRERQVSHRNDTVCPKQAINVQPHQVEQHSHQSPGLFGLSPSHSTVDHQQDRVHSANTLRPEVSGFRPCGELKFTGRPGFAAGKNRPVRRTGSLSLCTARQRSEQPWAAAPRRSSFPTKLCVTSRGERGTASSLRALHEHYVSMADNVRVLQDKKELTEKCDRLERLQMNSSLQSSTGQDFSRHHVEDKGVGNREPHGRRFILPISKCSSEGQQRDSNTTQSLDRPDKRHERTSESTQYSTANVVSQESSFSCSDHVLGRFSPNCVHKEDLIPPFNRPPDKVHPATTGHGNFVGGNGRCKNAWGVRDEVTSEDGGTHTPSNAADEAHLVVEAAGCEKATAAEESANPAFAVDAPAGEGEIQLFLQPISSTCGWRLQQGSSSGSETLEPERGVTRADTAKHTIDSFTKISDLPVSSETVKSLRELAQESPIREADNVRDNRICVAPKHVTAAAPRRSFLPATPRPVSGMHNTSSAPHPDVMTGSGTSPARSSFPGTRHKPEQALVAALTEADPIFAASEHGDASPATTPRSGVKSTDVSNSCSTRVPCSRSSHPAAQSPTSGAGGAKDNQHSLALALYTKLLATGLVPIESISPATAEWLHASLQGLCGGSSQPPAEAWKHVVTALASAASAAGKDSESLDAVHFRHALRSASVGPSRPQRRKDESRRTTVTRLRIQRSRANAVSGSPAVRPTAATQSRRDRPLRQLLYDVHVDTESQQQSESRETLALLLRLQEKAKKRLRSPPRAHRPLQNSSSTQVAAKRSAAFANSKYNSKESVQHTNRPHRLRSLETYIDAVRPSSVAKVDPSFLFDGFEKATGPATEAVLLRRRVRQPLSPSASSVCSSYGMLSCPEGRGRASAESISTSKASLRNAVYGSTYRRRRSGSMSSTNKGKADRRSVEISPARVKAQNLLAGTPSIAIKREHRQYERHTTLFLTHDSLVVHEGSAPVIPLPWEASRELHRAQGAGTAGICISLNRETVQAVTCCEAVTSFDLQPIQTAATLAQKLHKSIPLHDHQIISEHSRPTGRQQQPSLCVNLGQEISQKHRRCIAKEEPPLQTLQGQQLQLGRRNGGDPRHGATVLNYGHCTEEGMHQQCKKYVHLQDLRSYPSEPSKMITTASRHGSRSCTFSRGSPCGMDSTTRTTEESNTMQAAEAQNQSTLSCEGSAALSAEQVEPVDAISASETPVTAKGCRAVTESAVPLYTGSGKAQSMASRAAAKAESPAGELFECFLSEAYPLPESEQATGAMSRNLELVNAPAPTAGAKTVDDRPAQEGLQSSALAERPNRRSCKTQKLFPKKRIHNAARKKSSGRRDHRGERGSSVFLQSPHCHPTRLEALGTARGGEKKQYLHNQNVGK